MVHHEFRPCRDSDREWAYALKSEAYREVVERQFGPWDEPFQRALFNARWKPEASQVIVMAGAAVGLMVLEDRDGELWLAELQLVPEWRRRGLGSAILRELLGRSQAARKPLRLQVLKENRRARELYLRLGFRVTGHGDTHVLMEADPAKS
ncbi:MAG TPA: GNAT family N-acetyltransferase [Lacunisphaera sp.]|nr:GNAT family N-acetyltransferase [Lacunisphaera sp.]